jgi:uncharacterized membrane protein YdjX (TVP38/TMEM64 family)
MSRTSFKNRAVLPAFAAVCGLALAGVVFWWIRKEGYEVRAAIDWVLARVRGLGPGTFFSLMAVLPTLGVPVSVFTLTAGPVFAPVLGLPLVVVLSLLSLGTNLVLTYGLSRWVLRPWAQRLCGWLGFRIPEVSESDQRSLVILVRVTPGPPYVLQNYVLGLARVSFAAYFPISWAVVSVYSTAVIIFGDALVNGRGRGVLIGVGLLVAFVVGVRVVRKKMNRRKSAGAGDATSG